MRTRLLIDSLIVILVVAILHGAALLFFLYWQYAWYDIVVHFLGGVFLGLLLLWLLLHSGYFVAPTTRTDLMVNLLFGTLIIGALWELFEVVAGVPLEEDYALDTSTDLLMDFLGAFSAYLYYRLRYHSATRV